MRFTRFNLQAGSAFDLQFDAINDSVTLTVKHDKNLMHVRMLVRCHAHPRRNTRLRQLSQMGQGVGADKYLLQYIGIMTERFGGYLAQVCFPHTLEPGASGCRYR